MFHLCYGIDKKGSRSWLMDCTVSAPVKGSAVWAHLSIARCSSLITLERCHRSSQRGIYCVSLVALLHCRAAGETRLEDHTPVTQLRGFFGWRRDPLLSQVAQWHRRHRLLIAFRNWSASDRWLDLTCIPYRCLTMHLWRFTGGNNIQTLLSPVGICTHKAKILYS